MTASKLLTITFALLILNGCTSLNTRNTILRDIALGSVVGALIGQSKSTQREANTVLYAGVGGATAGALSALFNVPD